MTDNNQNTSDKTKEQKDPLLLDHNYDGIQELDHPLPSWWVTIFGVCVFFCSSLFFLLSNYGWKKSSRGICC